MKGRILAYLFLAFATVSAFAQETLEIPKDRMDTPLLLGSRIVKVSRSHGKVFAEGQRNPIPELMVFRRLNDREVILA